MGTLSALAEMGIGAEPVLRIGVGFFSSTLPECARLEANERVDCLSADWVLDFFVATMMKVGVKEDIELFPYSAASCSAYWLSLSRSANEVETRHGTMKFKTAKDRKDLYG